MIFLNAFLFSGFFCLIGELILDNTKLTPGHITTFLAIVGSFLAFLGVYDDFLDTCGAGTSILITNFGYLLFNGGMEGYYQSGILGIFTGLLTKCSLAICATIIFSFFFSLFFKPKD